MLLLISLFIILLLFIFLFIYAVILLVKRLYKVTGESNRAHVSLYSFYDFLLEKNEKEE